MLPTAWPKTNFSTTTGESYLYFSHLPTTTAQHKILMYHNPPITHFQRVTNYDYDAMNTPSSSSHGPSRTHRQHDSVSTSTPRTLGPKTTQAARFYFLLGVLSVALGYDLIFGTINNTSSDLLRKLKEKDKPPNTVNISRMELPRNISTHCWRTCPKRINKIFYDHGFAGLGDRLTVIDNLAQIAGYLCANLEVPPPSVFLHPIHNNGNVVSERVKWLDFRNITFLQDDTQVLASFDDKEEKFPGWLHIVSDGNAGSNGLLEDFVRLQEFALLQDADASTGFIWEIHTPFYQSNLFDRLLPPPSVEVQELSEYEDQMLPELPTYYYFHPEEAQGRKQEQRCRYTNNNPMRLQPTSMVSYILLV